MDRALKRQGRLQTIANSQQFDTSNWRSEQLCRLREKPIDPIMRMRTDLRGCSNQCRVRRQ